MSGVDRSKELYERLGWRLDDDVAPMDGLRIVQFTPAGSAASVTFGTGITTAAPGSGEEGGPHAITWTHADQVNTALLDFLRT